MQRTEQNGQCRNHRGDETIDHRVDLTLDPLLEVLQVRSDRSDIGFRRNVLVNRVEYFGSDALGLAALDIGVGQRVGQG